MGKRSSFARVERDFYPTPFEAVVPLSDHLPLQFIYYEPCWGAGDLWRHLSALTSGFGRGSDIDLSRASDRRWCDEKDAMSLSDDDVHGCDYIITNPPWNRKILHPMIEHFSSMKPTWLLFDADWVHTKQSAPFMPALKRVVSVGRVKWIPDTKMTGKDNCAWHLFDKNHIGPTEFYGRLA